MGIQQRYWNYLFQIKSWTFYLNIYADNSYRWQRRIDCYTAITSSSSIALWAIWKKYSFIWAIFIALSQIVNAIKVYLPFSKRLEFINPFINDLQTLFNNMDYKWFQVANGELSENEINEALHLYKNKFLQLEQKYLKGNVLPENCEYLKRADEKAIAYFNSNY